MAEKVIRSAANVDDEDETAFDERWLRDAAYRLAASLDPAASTAKAYAQKVRDYVKQIPWPADIIPKDNLGAFLKAPPDQAWPNPDKEAQAEFPFATIQSVKGREFSTAVVALPQNLRTDPSNQNVLDRWPARQGHRNPARALRRRITSADTTHPRRPHRSRQPRSGTTQTRWSPEYLIHNLESQAQM